MIQRSDFGFNNTYFDGRAEDHLITWWNTGGLNDYYHSPEPIHVAARGFIVEYDTVVPEPAAMALAVSGACLAAMRRRRRAVMRSHLRRAASERGS